MWTTLEAAIAPWRGREIWLEAALESAVVTVGPEGSRYEAQPPAGLPEPFFDTRLHIAYRVRPEKDRACFQLHRGIAQLEALLQEARTLDISQTLGLYQQLCGHNEERPA